MTKEGYTEIINFGIPLLGHHYCTLSLSDLSSREQDFK